MDVFTVCPEIERESPYLPSVSSVSHSSIEEMNQGHRTGVCSSVSSVTHGSIEEMNQGRRTGMC